MTETFKIKSVYANSKLIRLLYPLMFLGLIIFVSTNEFIKFKNEGVTALAGIALVVWGIFDVLKVMKLKKYTVSLDDHEINLNDEHVLKWSEINAITIHSVGFGMQEIITFNNNKKMNIPAVIENLEVLKNKIKNSVSEQCVITEK